MDKQTIVLVDFSALFRRAWHVNAGVSHAFEATVGGVNRAAKIEFGFPATLVAICCDGRGNWRKEIFPEYKAHRDKPDNSMYGEMDRTLERLRKDGRLIWKCDGFEADDVIATATKAALDRGHCVRIVSSDKDLMQLLNVKVEFQAIHAEGWPIVGPEKVREKFGVEPEQLGDWLALVGDSSDNVKGCPGIGEKKATELLRSFGSLAEIWRNIDPEPGFEPKPVGTPAIEKSLRANVLQVEKARKLVSLRTDAPINFNEIYTERKLEDLTTEDISFGDTDEIAKQIVVNLKSAQKEKAAEEKSDIAEKTQPVDDSVSGESLKADGALPVASAIVVCRDKTPEEIAEVCAPQETIAVVDFSRQLEPRSFKEATIYAQVMFNSRVYSRYPTYQSMVAAIVRGREMGYGAGASLDAFHVADFNYDGQLRLMMHAHLIIEQAMRHPDVEYIMMVSSTAEECTYEAKRRSHPKSFQLQYTIKDADLAQLTRSTKSGKPSNWMKRPREQLRKTCGAQISRVVAPGAAIGLYCPEELGYEE